MAGIGEEWTICHSNIAAAKLAMSCFPTNPTTPERLRESLRAQNGLKGMNLHPVKAHSSKRRPDKNTTRVGPRCSLTPTDPPRSIPAQLNNRVTKEVVPAVTILRK